VIELRDFIRDVPDFPRRGIVFKDITPLLSHPGAFAECVRRLGALVAKPEAVVAIESRGFIFGAGLALHWGVPFVPARKFGKLPGATVREVYSLEYGEDTLELHRDALAVGTRAVIVDDLLATGGTARATCELVKGLGGEVQALAFLIELVGLNGRTKLPGERIHSVLQY
jgi:adenine phosphoribosyltransferase